VACKSEGKKDRKSTSADPRQYANTAIKQTLSLSPSLYLARYKQAHNVGAKMPTDGILVPSPRPLPAWSLAGPHETTHNARFHRLSRRFSSLFPIRVTRGYARVDPRTGTAFRRT